MSEQSVIAWRRVIAASLLSITLTASAQIAPSSAKLGPAELQCESLITPLGMDAELPRLSWKLVDPRTAAKQTAYRIRVATRPSLLTANKPDLWDSGKIMSDQQLDVPYAGPTLKPETRYYWSVQSWDAHGKPYLQTPVSWWETGVKGDWSAAQWIGFEDLERRSIRAARPDWITNAIPVDYKLTGAVHHDFRLSFDLSSPVKKATLYATGQDSAAAWVNGQQVLSSIAQPKWGRTPWRTYAQADVKSAVHNGRNLLAIDILVYDGKGHPQTPMSAELYLEMADGSTRVITTDTPGWKATLNAQGGWFDSTSADSAWKPAVPFANQPDAFGFVEPLGNPLPTDPVAALRREFTARRQLRSARLYATALGAYKLFINGKPVGDQVLAPGWTDFRNHVIYQAYDVTASITRGGNAIGAWLAPGWYSTPLEWVGQGNNYGSTPPALQAKLKLEYTDGTSEWIATDDTWKADASPIEKAEIYDGETYNANLSQPGWSKSGFTGSWQPVSIIEPQPVKVEWQSYQPIKMAKSIAAVSVVKDKDGRYIYDFGQELSGVAHINVQGKRGTDVQLRFAEVLNPDGTIYTENLRNAKATDHYILSGTGREEYQPLFTFHGFRYVEVSGLASAPTLADVKAIVLHTAAPDTLTLETGSDMVNKLWSNIRWGQWSNFVGVPTDCPQRDERLGWAADAQVFWRAASYNMDLTSFSRKYAQDLRDTQVGTDMYGIYAPGTTKPNAGFGSGWSDAGVIVPFTSWLQTGDTRILQENWAGMGKYLAAIEAANPNHLWKEKSGIAFGDWLSPEGRTSQVLISTAYWAYDVHLMQQMAHALGKSEDEDKYARQFEAIKAAFVREFVHSDGFVGIADNPAKHGPDDALTETQTGYVLALHMNLLPADVREKAAKRLVGRLRANNWRLATGFLGTPYLLEELTKAGYPDIAYKLLLNKTYPSWGYMVEHGATTMWERWNGDAMRADPGMNSYNHYAYGAVADWIYRYAGGIDTDASVAGFHQVELHPRFDQSLGSLSLDYISRYGLIHSSWQANAGTVIWHVTIPANTSARLLLTPDQQKQYKLEGKPLNQRSDLREEHGPNGDTAYTLPSGTYSFDVVLTESPNTALTATTETSPPTATPQP
jgi:alpha-L-rhamnosidase